LKAIILNGTGGVDKLQYITLPKPEIRDNEVLVKLKSLSVNPVDFKTRKSGQMVKTFFGNGQPVILGWDISGIVEVSKSDKFKVGDEVFGMVNFPGNGSAYAEYVSAPAEHLAIKPRNVAHTSAAAATLAALTAYQVLVTYGNLTSGQNLLVQGASGGVGHYATQLGRHMGAQVAGTSSLKNKDFVLENGADRHIDYTKEWMEKEASNFDFVLDTIGDENILKSLHVTKDGGKIFSITSGNFSQEYLDLAAKRNISLSFILVKSSGEDMQIIADLLANGTIKSHISAIYSFDDMRLAHEALETGRTVGKIVIEL
jgi:NADPH:quinone reductase-like Zn-dependent oxidoreductase